MQDFWRIGIDGVSDSFVGPSKYFCIALTPMLKITSEDPF